MAIQEGSGEPPAGKTPEKSLKDVNGDVYTLYIAVDRADAAPTPAQVKAAAETESDLALVMKRWEEIKGTDIPALNRQLKSANLTEIQLAAIPQMEEEAGEDLE
jgi:hypothetical protein